MKAPGVIQLEITEHLVGGDVVVAHPMATDSLEQGEGAHQVRRHEGRGVVERIVVVRFGRKVHHRVDATDQITNHVRITDISVNEGDGGQTGEGFAVSGVGQGVKNGEIPGGALPRHEPNEVRPDESCASGHEQSHDPPA